MLYLYNGKIYVKPFDHKMVEVNVTKKGNEYNVEATEKWVEINDKILDNTYSVTLEKAYEMQNKKDSKKFDLE